MLLIKNASAVTLVAALGILILAAAAQAMAEASTRTALAFAASRPGASGIYLITSDGVETRLTREIYDASHPAWSPDGKSIAFNARVNGREEIFVMDAGGANVRQLTENQGDNYYPSWSPDSQQLAIASDRDGLIQVYVMNADGTNVRRLTDGTSRAEKPAWSPDGSEIAIMLLDGNNAEVYAVRVDGTDERRLTNHRASDFNPAWSPDGSKIAFNSSRAGDHEIYVMNSDGSNVSQLTNASGWSERPVWSPDGSQIAFYSDRDGNPEVYLMDADGSNVKRLTNNSGFDGQPTWQPLSQPPTQPTPVAAPTALPFTDWKYPVYVLDVLNGRTISELHAVEASDLTSRSTLSLRYAPEIIFSSDGSRLLVLDTYFERGTRGDNHDVLSVFNSETFDLIQDDIPVPDRLRYKVFPVDDRWLIASPNGEYLFVGKYGDPDISKLRLTVLDAKTYQQLAEYPYPQCDDRRLHVMNNSQLLCVRDGMLIAINPLTGGETIWFKTILGANPTTLLSADRTRWFHLDRQGKLTEIDLAAFPTRSVVENKQLDVPAEHSPGGSNQVILSPDASRLFIAFTPTSGDLYSSGQADIIRVYDTQTWEMLDELKPRFPASYLALSRDGTQLYLTNPQARIFAVYDAHTLRELGIIEDFGITPSRILVPTQ
jgi:Tol biopolymer transport system component